MSKKLRRRIWRFMDDRMVPAGRFIAGSRPVQWLSRRRSVRVTVGILCLLGALALRYVWRPLKRRVDRIVRFVRRREILGWIVAWVMCGWIALAILQQQRFLMGLMLGLVIAGGYAIISLRSPLTGLIMWLMASPFLTMYIAVKPLPGMPVISGDRYCLAVLLLVYLIHLRRYKPAHPNPWLHGMMAVFIIAMLVSALPNRHPKGAAQAVLDTYAAPFLVYVFARRWVSDRRSLAIAVGAMMFVGLYFSFIGIPEHYMGKLLLRPHRVAWVEEALGTMRAQGPAESPSEFGLVVLAAWLLALTAFVHERQTRRRLVYATIVVVAAIAISLTLRRSVYASVMLALICMLAASGRTRRTVAAIAVVGGVGFLIFWPQFTATKVYRTRIMEVGPIYTRAVVYATSWEILKDRPLFGVGTLNYPEYSSQYLTGYKDISPFYGRHVRTTHNAYLRIAVERRACRVPALCRDTHLDDCQRPSCTQADGGTGTIGT